MGLENVKCFKCQEYGHLERDCPQNVYGAELGDGKPPWCGREVCDRETRLVCTQTADGLKASRCPHCHPQSHSLPIQFTKCKGCRNVIYRWDNRTECGKHQPVGKQLEYVKPALGDVKEDTPERRKLAAAQVAEARAARGETTLDGLKFGAKP